MHIKTANGKEKLVLSREEWKEIGKRAGWGGGPHDAGPGGECECPHCGCKTEHQAGKPCRECKCPECGKLMARDIEECEGEEENKDA